MFKLALNAGHGINTPGKRCLKSIDPNETREWRLNSRICSKIEERLIGYSGIEIKRIDDVTGNTDIPISKRATNANDFNADLYLSIHHNAGINGGSGGGIVVFTYLTVDEITAKLQQELYNAAILNTGLKGNRANPVGVQNLGECRMTRMPAILMECGFMDSTTDTPVILTENFANHIADACVQVIIAHSGAIPVSNKSDNKNIIGGGSDKIISSGNNLYRVRKSYDDPKSQVGAFTVLDNAVKLAKNAGNDVYDSTGACVWKYNDCLSRSAEPESIDSAAINNVTQKQDLMESKGIIQLLNQILKILRIF